MVDTKIDGAEGGALGPNPRGTEQLWAQSANGNTDYDWTTGDIQKWARSGNIKAAYNQLVAERGAGDVAMFKVRDTGAVNEVHIEQQLGANVPDWVRWMLSNHSNSPSGTGSLRMSRCTRATLDDLRSCVPPGIVQHVGSLDSHNNDVIQSIAKIWETGDGVETGTFSTSTLEGLTTRRSDTTGDNVVYTVRGVELLLLRGYGTTNGGTFELEISPAPSSYLVPDTSGEYLIDVRSTGAFIGLKQVPLAILDPLTEYTVTLTVHTSNPSGGRMYQGGLVGYDIGWKTTPGAYGSLQREGSEAAYRRQEYANERIVYRCARATKIIWKPRAKSDKGIATFEIYDACGNSVTPDLAEYDCYAAVTVVSEVTVVSGLPLGDYYLHVLVKGEKNASSSSNAIDHNAVVSSNENEGGDPSSGTFDLNGATALASSIVGVENFIGYDSTNDRVASVRKTSEAPGMAGFVGGVHGNEDFVSAVYKMDGVVVDFAGASAGDRWVGKKAEIVVTTNLKIPSDGTVFGTAVYTHVVDHTGYHVTVVDTLTMEVKYDLLYPFMLTYVSTYTAGAGVGDGFADPTTSADGKITLHPSNQETDLERFDAAAVYNDDWAIVGYSESYQEVFDVFDPLHSNADTSRLAFISINSRAGSPITRDKFYLLGFHGDDVTVPNGTTYTIKSQYGVAKTKNFGQQLGLTW